MSGYSGDELILLPWQINPRQIISWWEMEQFSARAFFWAGCLIEDIRRECYMGALVVDPDQKIYNMMAPLDSAVADRAIRCFKQVEEQCRSIGLRLSAETAKDAWSALEGTTQTLLNYQWLRDHVSQVKNLIGREMEGHGFFYISPERGKFWTRTEDRSAFGDSVADAFGSSYFDAGQAAICLAIGLGTACVFHSMRVLEIGLSTFGAVFGVSLAHTNWEPAIREIESKVREMHNDPAWKAIPDRKLKQETYAQAASHFGVLKDAWRNYTMHIRGKYTEDEAEMIFLNVRGFMQRLAAIGLKEAV